MDCLIVLLIVCVSMEECIEKSKEKMKSLETFYNRGFLTKRFTEDIMMIYGNFYFDRSI